MSREFLWEPLGKLATVKAGTTPPRSDGDRFFNAGTINWVKTGDLNDGWLSETVERVTEEAVDETSLIVHPPGTVLVAMYGGFQQIGRSAILERPAATNQAISALIPDPSKLHGEFLNYCLIFFRPDWRKVAASSRKDPNITKQDVLKFEIPVPALQEQRRIAEILSCVDEAIAATRAVIEQTRKVKQGVLERLLTKGIGHTHFKHTEIGEIPAGWKVAELIDVSDTITVGIASSATHAYRSDGIPLLRNQNIKAGVLDLADLLFVSPEYDAENASKRVKTGDVVSMRTGYPGRSAVVPPELDGCQTFTTLVTKPKPSLINSDFLCAWINSDGGMKQVRRLQAGGAQQNLNAGVLKKLLLPLPPLTEQKQIALSAQSLLFDEEREIGALSELKSALMSDLLTGRKRVTDALPLAAE